MMSFVICFHSSRTENLRQTLRMLSAREKCDKEIVLVCNDSTHEKFPGCRLVNMGLSEYKKTIMCNEGVARAKNDIVALLDSDRIMPRGYFSRQASELRPGEFVSCEKMLHLLCPHTDEEIDSERLKFQKETRSKGWELWRKNLFSGNTLFYKGDYLASGGQDERFVGYGFADNDMTRNVISKGFKPKWTEDTEIHLYHPPEVMQSGSVTTPDSYMKRTRINMCFFLLKWKDFKEYERNCGCIL